jgi:arsenite methyltransferase
MAERQKEFYDSRFSSTKRGLTKLTCPPIHFYDGRLIKTTFEALKMPTRVNYLVEIGCGQGTDAILLSDYADNLIAIDISVKATKVAKELSRTCGHCDNLSFIVADSENLPFNDGEFDVVFCKDVLHHLSDSLVSLVEARRITKQEGKVVAIEANALNPQMVLIGLIYYQIDKGVFKNTKSNLINVFEKAGFLEIEAKETEFLPRHMLFEYRSPLCLPVVSQTKFLLRILSRTENLMQDLYPFRNFSNYIIIYGVNRE